jgi:hypothetical protein
MQLCKGGALCVQCEAWAWGGGGSSLPSLLQNRLNAHPTSGKGGCICVCVCVGGPREGAGQYVYVC